MSTQSLDSDIYDYGFILNSTALHEAAMSVLVTTIYGRWRGTTTSSCSTFNVVKKNFLLLAYSGSFFSQIYT